jgi:ligand-binding sensor domain-containing protein
MKKLTYLFLVYMLLFISQTNAQVFTNYTYESTLTMLCNNYVCEIATDADGSIWFGTWGGVSKYDGTIWKTYTNADGLASNHVSSIAIDLEGNKWFGYESQEKGVTKFDGTKWTTYTTADGLASNNVSLIAIDAEGNKWFGTWGRGVTKFDGTIWTTYDTLDGLASNNVFTIAVDLEGIKWFGTSEGVSKFDGTTWTTYDTLDGLASNYVSEIAVDLEGNKWFGYNPGYGFEQHKSGGGVSKFDGINWTTYTEEDGLASNGVSDIAVDLDGNIWFGYTRLKFGITKFDGTHWTNYRIKNYSYTSDAGNYSFIADMVIDSKGNKWVSLNICYYLDSGVHPNYTRLGVLKFDGTNWTNYTTGGLPGNFICSIAIDEEGNKWFGTWNGGVLKFDGTNWTTYSTIDGLSDMKVITTAIDLEGNKWFGTADRGVSKFDGTDWQRIPVIAKVITIDAEGNKWFGTDHGVSKLDDNTWTNYDTLNGLASNHVYSIAIDLEGNIWFGYGFEEKGVSKFDGINWATYTTADGLASNNVNAIATDPEGNIWFGCEMWWDDWQHKYIGGGVSKFDGINWATYNTADGLASNNVHAIAIDAEGNKWFGTWDGGVTKFDGTTWTTYDTVDGLASNNVHTIAIDAEGNKWFGISDGGISKLSGNGSIVNLSVSPGNQDVGFDTGSTEFSVTSNALWTISNDANWLTLSRTSLGTSATIIAKFTENTSSSPRVATITIYGPGINTQYVNVTQSGYTFVPSLYDLNVTIYPNPIKDYLFIKFDDATLTDISISVVDVSGRFIIKRNFEHIDLDEEKTLDLSFMKSGLYFLEIRSEKNSRVYKIIKE